MCMDPNFVFILLVTITCQKQLNFPGRLRGTPYASRPLTLRDEEGSWECGLMEPRQPMMLRPSPALSGAWEAVETASLPLFPRGQWNSLSSWQNPPARSLKNDKHPPLKWPTQGCSRRSGKNPCEEAEWVCHPHVIPLLSLTPPQGNPGVRSQLRANEWDITKWCPTAPVVLRVWHLLGGSMWPLDIADPTKAFRTKGSKCSSSKAL